MNKRIGSCSICGGDVVMPNIWHGTVPPVPRCRGCGATAAKPGPVIPMEPAPHDGPLLNRRGWVLGHVEDWSSTGGRWIPNEKPGDPPFFR